MIHNFYFRIVQVPTYIVFVLLGIYYWMLCRLRCIRFARHNLKVPRCQRVHMFMLHFHTKFCSPTSGISTVTATKPKNKEHLYHTAMFLVYILQKIYIIGASETSWMSGMPHTMDNVLSISRRSFGRVCILSSKHDINWLISSSICDLVFQIFSF